MKDESKSTRKVYYSIQINATKEKVWKTMLKDDTYRKWTSVFTEGSHFKGSWDEGSKILFLDPRDSGMVSKIVKNKLYDFISIEHVGLVNAGKEDVDSEEARSMAGAHENYTFKERNGVTELLVEMDLSDEYKTMFDNLWPKALLKLKDLAEK